MFPSKITVLPLSELILPMKQTVKLLRFFINVSTHLKNQTIVTSMRKKKNVVASTEKVRCHVAP